ncbi:MAG: hypothetical protein U0Q55_22680 [Vicinamibacterales bacterium]
MRTLYRIAAAMLVAVMLTDSTLLALDSKDAAYYGGTITVFGNPKDAVEGKLDTSDEKTLLFAAYGKEFAGKTFSITYAKISDLEYGQKAGRRVGAAAATTVLLGPLGLITLFSKKRKHYLTIGFKDDADKDQVAVLELGKDMVRTTLAIIQTRSGKQVEYQDEEAKKSGK